MKHDKLDVKIKERLLQETEISQELKNTTWQNIKNELHDSAHQPKQSKRNKWITGLVIAVAVMIIVVGTMTEPGRAMLQQIKNSFLPEKEVEFEIEGQKEEGQVQLEMNEDLNYVIYYDETRYKMEKANEVDRLTPLDPMEDPYPEVYMEIHKQYNAQKDKLLKELEDELDASGLSLMKTEEVSEPVDARRLYAVESNALEDGELLYADWNTVIQRYYVITVDEDAAFVIKQQYFLEAEEGHGARFDAMLESFEVIEKDTETIE